MCKLNDVFDASELVAYANRNYDSYNKLILKKYQWHRFFFQCDIREHIEHKMRGKGITNSDVTVRFDKWDQFYVEWRRDTTRHFKNVRYKQMLHYFVFYMKLVKRGEKWTLVADRSLMLVNDGALFGVTKDDITTEMDVVLDATRKLFKDYYKDIF